MTGKARDLIRNAVRGVVTMPHSSPTVPTDKLVKLIPVAWPAKRDEPFALGLDAVPPAWRRWSEVYHSEISITAKRSQAAEPTQRPPIALPDAELDAVMKLTASLEPALRDPFRRALAALLERYKPAEIGPNLVKRVGRQLLQREFAQMSKPQQPVDSLPPLSPLELRRIVGLDEASRLSGLSKATIKLRHADKIIKLSPRRVGMRVGDALALQSPTFP